MAKQTTTRSGRYLYAIVAGARDMIYGPFGVDNGVVYAISNGRISAVVSDVPNERIRPERRHIAAHHEVLKRLINKSTVIPMSFGIIANGHKAVKTILTRNQEDFLQQTRRIAGKVEMGVRVIWDVPNIFEYFVNTNSELKSARDQVFGTGRKPTQDEKIEVGRMFERIRNENREIHTYKVEEILSRCCAEVKRNKCRNEREVMNLACLVERSALAHFDTGIFEVARVFDNNFALNYHGPWAPHNFVEIRLEI